MTWHPGEPLFTHPKDIVYSLGRQHVRPMIQLMSLGDYEECHCIDRASWPEPWLGTELKPTEALKPLWGEPV